MKKQYVCLYLLAAAALVTTAQASVTINITGGVFRTADAAHSALIDGRLIQLIASPGDLVFSAPSASSFVSGDDFVIGSAPLDSSVFNVDGSSAFTLTVNYEDFPLLASGTPLLLRWYDLPFGITEPGENASYGEFRSDSAVDGGDPWMMVDDGGLLTLSFVTTDLDPGGSQPSTAGIVSSAVPEPSVTVILAGAAALGLTSRRRKI
ncbi:MAG: PEP-CTERM sorting domain-containing protein [Luteolibacter sp.]